MKPLSLLRVVVLACFICFIFIGCATNNDQDTPNNDQDDAPGENIIDNDPPLTNENNDPLNNAGANEATNETNDAANNADNEPAQNEANNDQANADDGQEMIAIGEDVVQDSCITCHGANLEGVGSAPSLDDVGQRLTADEIYEVTLNGRGSMPGGLADGYEEEVTSYLMEISNQ